MRATSLSSKHVFGRTDVCCSSTSISRTFVRFPPHKTFGIAVLRLPKDASLSLLEKFVSDLSSMLDAEPITGRLWIVEAGRIRVHENTIIEPNEAK